MVFGTSDIYKTADDCRGCPHSDCCTAKQGTIDTLQQEIERLKSLLKLAGRLAISVRAVTNSPLLTLSRNIEGLITAVDAYDFAIEKDAMERKG